MERQREERQEGEGKNHGLAVLALQEQAKEVVCRQGAVVQQQGIVVHLQEAVVGANNRSHAMTLQNELGREIRKKERQ